MRCPECGCLDDKVIDTRVSKDGDSIRRRRECLKCTARFTTYEAVANTEKSVEKRDGRREDFSPEKLRTGVKRACQKRPVSDVQIDELVKRVAAKIEALAGREVPSRTIGEMVMAELQELDEVAYVRFASVYRRFKDTNQFIREIRKLSEHQEDKR